MITKKELQTRRTPPELRTFVSEVYAKDKSLKDYSGISVIFVLAEPPPLPGLEKIFETKFDRLKSIISNRKFTAKGVFLYIPYGRVDQIYG